MAQPLTYQQLLAEQYDENAKDRLVFQNTLYDEDEEGDAQFDPHVSERKRRGNELEEQESYRQFAGNRNLEENLIKAKEFEDKSKLSVRYNKDVKLNVFSIDSRFRAFATAGLSSVPQPTSDKNATGGVLSTVTSVASHFIFRSSKQIKNAISIKMTSMELQNTFSNFLASRGNTSFLISNANSGDYYPVTIPDGYYSKATQIASAIQKELQTNLPSGTFPNRADFRCSVSDGLLTISQSVSHSEAYDFDFIVSPFTYGVGPSTTTQIFDTFGALLGFSPTTSYKNINLFSAPLVALYELDMEPDDYIYLKLNDYSTVIPQTTNDTYYTVFAKIPITVPKGNLIIDNDSTNSTTKEFRFLQPTNIQQLEIQLLDRSGQELIFNGNFSMTLEVEEVVSHSLYEKLREL
jgi:hypothetical protein